MFDVFKNLITRKLFFDPRRFGGMFSVCTLSKHGLILSQQDPTCPWQWTRDRQSFTHRNSFSSDQWADWEQVWSELGLLQRLQWLTTFSCTRWAKLFRYNKCPQPCLRLSGKVNSCNPMMSEWPYREHRMNETATYFYNLLAWPCQDPLPVPSDSLRHLPPRSIPRIVFDIATCKWCWKY